MWKATWRLFAGYRPKSQFASSAAAMSALIYRMSALARTSTWDCPCTIAVCTFSSSKRDVNIVVISCASGRPFVDSLCRTTAHWHVLKSTPAPLLNGIFVLLYLFAIASLCSLRKERWKSSVRNRCEIWRSYHFCGSLRATLWRSSCTQ